MSSAHGRARRTVCAAGVGWISACRAVVDHAGDDANCPRTSIYEASERDFRIVVIEDALSGFDDRARTELESIGVRVLDTESFLREAV